MTKKELIAKLKEKRIYNSFEFVGCLGGSNIYITRYNSARYRHASFSVKRPGYNTDPKAHFMNNGCKTFTICSKNEQAAVLEEAKKWAGDKYSITEWIRNPYGDWMSKALYDKRMKELEINSSTKNTSSKSIK